MKSLVCIAAVQLFKHEDHQGASFLLSVAFPKAVFDFGLATGLSEM